ncbi:hypothetical protein FRX31_019579 [Thalictrum thalictroides]|uniref:Uncharacterized protein n=1 Tax=Thalictrum thalictroides TaxID=46969 RepID=A0A7J6W164_THATH|nr:hypothetical protein FRX31_019579 [Thalictrum thalictroides]
MDDNDPIGITSSDSGLRNTNTNTNTGGANGNGNGNGNDDDETLIREKKRARRVSFAENTSIHIFQRDDEDYSNSTTTSETTHTTNTTPPSSNPQLRSSSIENAGDNDDDDEDDLFNDFISSTSTPGSATGSATSNEEDNYFGPVSTSFIRLSQQKSDSSPAPSDFNHDLTLDSTAMSLHFQSLLHPTSTSTTPPNFHTPPTITPQPTTNTNGSGSSMLLTHKKPLVFPFPIVPSGGDSSDMSLIESNPSNKYDYYGKLSPTLQALLAHSYHASSVSDDDHISISKSLSDHLNTQVSSPTLSDPRLKLHMDYKGKQTVTEDIPIQMGSSNLVEPNVGNVTPSTPNYLPDASITIATPAHQKQTLFDSIQDQYSKLTTMEQRQESADGANAPRGDANASIILGKRRGMVDKDSHHQPSQKEHTNVGDFLTPMRWMCSAHSPLGSPDMSFLTRTDPARTGNLISVQKSLHKSASPRVRKTATAFRLVKRLVDVVVEDRTGKETQPFSERDSMHPFVRKGPLSYANIQSSNGHGHGHQHQNQLLQENISVEDVDGYGRKREIEDIGRMDKSNVVEIRNKNSTVNIEMGGSVLEDWSNLSRVGNSELEKSRAYEAQGKWANGLKELSGDIEGLLIPSIGKLNTRELEILENMVRRMRRVTKYEKLCTLAQFQRAHDLQANHHQERIAEARCVQETLVYERAKLLMLRANQEKLRKQVQLLQSGIQDAIHLKFNVKKVLQNGATDTHMKNISSSNSNAYNKVITKHQELGVLDLKVKNLIKSVLASCKIKDEPSPDKCISLINDYLNRKTQCRLIQKELQLFEVDKMERENGQHIVVLNFCDVLLQSFTKSHASYSTLVTFNSVNIMKIFPNINASTAFAFVFNEVTRNLVSSKSLAAETQVNATRLD